MKNLLCFGLAIAMLAALLALTSCNGGMSGTYYSESGDLCIILDGLTWSLGEPDAEAELLLSGPYVAEGSKISFQFLVEDGDNVEAFTGEISGDRLVIGFSGELGTTTFYKDGKTGLMNE